MGFANLGGENAHTGETFDRPLSFPGSPETNLKVPLSQSTFMQLLPLNVSITVIWRGEWKHVNC